MCPKKVMKMAWMWEKLATSHKRRISNPGVTVELNSTSALEKGHLVIYMTDGGRFTIPLQCIQSNIFDELLKISKEEFSLSGDSSITVPCDAASMGCIVSLVQRCIAKDREKALLNSIPFTPCSLAAAVHSKCMDQQSLFLCQ
ncbi:hypothetical protein BT93_G1125 [Corymbia citriodora subsp. variegata]|nr:hypothetical protein BT93_G1125 [Corymbia citriodora subsp. variegata]